MGRLRTTFLTGLCWSLFLYLNAQSATLKGYVEDAETGEKLVGASIMLFGDGGTVTDFDGTFEFLLPAGNSKINISYIGYEAQEIEISLATGEVRELNISLKEEATLLETATVTAGKFERPLSEVTVSLEVLKPALLESNNIAQVDAVLDKVPGVNMIDGQANIRGGSGYSYGAGSRVLLLIDDIPILQADAGFPNWADVPVENIEQIEVVKGAASALYGSSAMNGIINIRTAFAKAAPETKIAAFHTTYLDPKDKRLIWWDKQPATIGSSVVHRRKFGEKVDFVGGLFYFRDSSYNQSTYEHYGRGYISSRYRITDRISIGVNANFNKGSAGDFFYWKGADSLVLQGAATTFSSRKRFRYNIDPYFTAFDEKGNWHKVLGRFYSVDNDNSNNQSNQSQLYYGEYQFQRLFAGPDLVVTAGLVGMGTNVVAEIYGDTSYSSSNMAAYAQVEKKFFNRLNTSFGFRYERNTISSPEVVEGVSIPGGKATEAKPGMRVGLNYKLADFTFLRASWGQGYRFPTIAEKFIKTNAGFPIIPNPLLESETGWSSEIGLKQGFRIKQWQGFVDLAGFWSEYQNMMEFGLATQGFGFQSQNVGDTRIVGGEITIAGQGKIGPLPLALLAGYTYIDPKFQEFDVSGKTLKPAEVPNATVGQLNARFSLTDYNVLKYRFKHSVKLDMESGFGNLSIGVAGFYNSNMENIDQVFALIIPGVKTFREANDKGATVVNFRAGYKFGSHFKLSALLNNAFNVAYTNRPALLEAPRNISVRVEVKF